MIMRRRSILLLLLLLLLLRRSILLLLHCSSCGCGCGCGCYWSALSSFSSPYYSDSTRNPTPTTTRTKTTARAPTGTLEGVGGGDVCSGLHCRGQHALGQLVQLTYGCRCERQFVAMLAPRLHQHSRSSSCRHRTDRRPVVVIVVRVYGSSPDMQ